MFTSIFPQRHLFAGDDQKHLVDDAGAAFWRIFCGINSVRKLPKRIDCSLETHACEITLMPGGGFLHECPNQVVGDDEHAQFFTDHFRGFAAEHLHAHRCFNMAKKQLKGPSAKIQFGQIITAVDLCIEYRGDQIVLVHSEALDFYTDTNDPQFECFG